MRKYLFAILVSLIVCGKYVECKNVFEFDNQIIINYSSDTLKGYDSLGRRQGEWWDVKVDNGMAFFEENNILFYTGTMNGLYIDNLKQGLWAVFDTNSVLISHRYYKNDTIQYEIFYDNKKRIKSIVKPIKKEDNNCKEGAANVCLLQVIYYDKRGRPHSMKNISSDGLIFHRVY